MKTEKPQDDLIEFYKYCILRFPTNNFFYDKALELSPRLSKEDLYKDARLYFISFPQLFHINDRVEFDHVAGTDLKDSGREEMKDDDFICPSLE